MENLNEKYVTISGTSIRYVIRGTGPSILLIHGFGEFLEVWWLNIATLSECFTVYALDLPGHGRSQEPPGEYTIDFVTSFIVDFMNALGIEHASLIGHSLGGTASLIRCHQLSRESP